MRPLRLIITVLICTCAPASLIGSIARADDLVIYDNGAPAPGAGGLASDFAFPHQLADDFVLFPDLRTITRLDWWGRYETTIASPGADDFTIRIFADNGSAKPVATPLYERHVGASATRTRLEPNLFQYSVGVPPVALNGATRYWLSIVNHTTWAPDVYWWWSSVDSVPFAPYGRAVDAGDWFQFQSGGGAFQLFVPEPSSPALVCAGTVVMLARRRRSCLRDDVTAIAAPA